MSSPEPRSRTIGGNADTAAEGKRAGARGGSGSPRKRRLHPTIVAAGWVSFFTDLGSEIIYPLLPLFFIEVLGGTRVSLGAVEGLAEGAPAVIRLFSGALSDRLRNRKWLILSGYFLSSVFKPLIGMSRSALEVALLRFGDRVGKGVRTAPRDALVADCAHADEKGRAFGFQRAMDHLGALGGGVAAFALLQWSGLSLRQIIMVSALPGVLCLLTIFFFVHDAPRGPGAAGGNPGKRGFGLRPPRELYGYLSAVMLFNLANSSDAFLLLRARELGLGVALVPLLWAYLHLVKAATITAGGRWSDRVGRKRVLAAGWSLYGVVYVGMAFSSHPAAAWIWFTLYGLFFGLTEGAARAAVADLVTGRRRGAAYGAFGLAEGAAVFLASLWTGWLWDVTGSSRVPFLLCGLLAVAGAVRLMTLPEAGLRRSTR